MKDSNQRDASADDKQSITSLFAERLRHFRKQRGLSRKELAMRAGISEPSVASYEQGIKVPGLDKLAAIARALDIPMENLVSDLSCNESERYFACLKILDIAQIRSIQNWNDRTIKLLFPPRIILNADGEIIPKARQPVIMHKAAFVAVFERIIERALTSANLSEIIDDELQRLQ